MAQACNIRTDFVALSERFSGKWVAIDPVTREVIASGSAAKEVAERAREKNIEEPLILKVSDDYGSYISWLA